MTHTSAKIPRYTFRFCVYVVSLALLAQSIQAAGSASTLPGQAPGTPIGSFHAGGFDAVNLFNGHLNFRLPLLEIGGRGRAGFSLGLPIDHRWLLLPTSPDTPDSFTPAFVPFTSLTPGFVRAKHLSEGCQSDVTQTQTILSLTTSNGTEIEFRDNNFVGQKTLSQCNEFDPGAGMANRGRWFFTEDHSFTFISDTDILDMTQAINPIQTRPSGYLLAKINGLETWQIYGFRGELLAEYMANGAAASPQKEYGYRNGQLLVTAEPTSGGGSGATVQNVTWTNAVGVAVTGNNLTRTAVGDGWNAGATSSQSIASGDGYTEFTASETNKKRSAGLTDSTSVTSYQHIDYGIILGEDGQITIHEGIFVYGSFGTYVAGDKLRVAVEGGVVKYRKNGTLLRTSTLAPTYPLRAGAALYTNSSTVTNVILTSGAGSSSTQVRWLVADQLGTPRMIVAESGSLDGLTRHDYLPFGEQLFAHANGRSTSQGYSHPDGVRQGFTGYEADLELTLNFAQARYHSSTAGRFISPDPLLASVNLGIPQSWNRYTYCLNNPLIYIDPSGLVWITNGGDNPTYKWVDDDKYDAEYWKEQGWTAVPNGTEVYLGWVSGEYEQYRDLVGGYVTLNSDGTVALVIDDVLTTNVSADPPFEATGYWDFNLSYATRYFAGPTGGVMFNDKAIHPYFGLSASATRGFGWSFTYSPNSVTEGLNAELQISLPLFGRSKPGVTIVHGYDSNGDSFQGFGTGSPGASVSGYYVAPNMYEFLKFLNPRNTPLVPMPDDLPRSRKR